MVFAGQVVAQELERGKVNGAGREQCMDDGEASPETSGGDAAKRFVFAHSESAGTKVEHRRVAGDEVETPFFDFGEKRDELRREFAIASDEAARHGEQFFVGVLTGLHAFRLARRFSCSS